MGEVIAEANESVMGGIHHAACSHKKKAVPFARPFCYLVAPVESRRGALGAHPAQRKTETMNTNTERLVVGGGALVLGLLLGWMVRGVATYNTGAESSVPYGDWRVACPAATTKDASCEMVSNLLDPKTKDIVARVSVSHDVKQGQVLALVLPLNTMLEQGVAIKLGNTDPKIYKFRTCTQNGCISVTPADDKAIDAIASADKVTLMSMSALPGATRQDTVVSLNGFNAARSAYISGNRKRSGFFWRLF